MNIDISVPMRRDNIQINLTDLLFQMAAESLNLLFHALKIQNVFTVVYIVLVLIVGS